MIILDKALRKNMQMGMNPFRALGKIRSMMKLLAVLVLLMSLSGVPVQAATQQDIDTAWNGGLAWLLQHQNPDGSWGSVEGAKIMATAEALHAFSKVGVRNYAYAAGLAWLAAAKTESVDSLARKIVALNQAGIQTDSLVTKLFEWQNQDSIWGTYKQFDSSFPDTALASYALRVTNAAQFHVEEALKVMLQNQINVAPDIGSWTYYPRYPLLTSQLVNGRGGSLVATSYNLIELQAGIIELGLTKIEGMFLSVGRDSGISWLLVQQNGDGGFGGFATSSILETALAFRALNEVDPQNSATTSALDFLLAQQDQIENGWSSDALQTAAVLAAFPFPSSIPLLDTDGDGIPDGVEGILGTNPLVPDSRDILLKGPLAQGAQGQGSGSGGSSGGENPPTIIPDGDVNEDGLVTVADLALLEQFVLGFVTPTGDQIFHGDVAPTGIPDGVLNVADVERLGRIIAEGL